jgi:BirA family biotin operon repressor/biotin-[acetyl-CoA-carboxylase] ligase
MQSQKIIVLEKVDSTNNYAMGLIREGVLMNGSGVFAREQFAGKGRRGKTWASGSGENIILSIALEMGWQSLLHQFPLSVSTALACHDLISPIIKEKVFLKWPNDIFINDSKAAGVLIENVVKGTLWQWAVIGIGMNVNQTNFEEMENKVISLKLLTGKEFPVIPLAEELQSAILNRVDQLKEGHFPEMLEEYNQHLYARDRTVKLRQQNRIFETTIKGVSEKGELLTKDIFERQFKFEEVTFIGFA